MPDLSQDAISAAVSAALSAITSAPDTESLKSARQLHLGENGVVPRMRASLRELPPAERAEPGARVGKAMSAMTAALADREATLARADAEAALASEYLDMTAVPAGQSVGARHPLCTLQDLVCDVFTAMGWEVAEGPEIESEWYNFDALNFDPDHPARAMQDTFFVEPPVAHLVLRTHTSPVQIRSLLTRELPIYVLAPGRVFRTDELDATHTPVFMQFEGLAVDRGLTMADLKGTLDHFVRAIFGEDAKVRLRPSYFPFTEPSAELDFWHPNFPGGARWIEWGGCGMVHPHLLRATGVDPDVYQGFAFGMGIERGLMLRNGVLDMREMVEGDLRFSEQFGMVV